MTSRALPVSYIKVGKRYRKDLGDLSALADSIRLLGLIHPIVVDKNHNLIAGQRRLEAWKTAKPDQAVPAVVVDTLDDAALRLAAERDENTCRKDMTASELYALGKQIEKLERPRAEAATTANLPNQPKGSAEPVGRTNEKVGPAVGMSVPQWKRLKSLGDDAASGDSRARALLEEVDAGEKSLTSAYEEHRGYEKTETGRRARSADLPDTVGNVRTITKRKPAAFVLDRVCDQLDGLADVLDKLDIAEVKPAEAERLAASLSRSRSVLSKTINQLRSIA